MEIDFKDGSEKLKRLISSVKDCINNSDDSAKTAQFVKIMTDFFPNPIECDYYLTIIEIFSQISEIINTSEGKALLATGKGKALSNTVLNSPLYTSLYYASLQLQKELKYLKKEGKDIQAFANALAKSETEKMQLELAKKKLEENYKMEADMLKRANSQKVANLEDQIGKLQSSNAALSKKGKGQVDALNAEITKLQAELKSKMLQMQRMEDQFHQQSLILTNEKIELTTKLAEANKSKPKENEMSDEIALADLVTAQLLKMIDSRRKFLAELDVISKSESSAPGTLTYLKEAQKSLEAKKEQYSSGKAIEDQLKQQLETTNNEISKIDSEIESLKQNETNLQSQLDEQQKKQSQFQSEIDELSKKVADLEKAKEEKNATLNSLMESVEKKKVEAQQAEENVSKLDSSINQFEETLNNQKAKLDEASSKIENIQNKETELKSKITDVLNILSSQIQQSDF